MKQTRRQLSARCSSPRRRRSSAHCCRAACSCGCPGGRPQFHRLRRLGRNGEQDQMDVATQWRSPPGTWSRNSSSPSRQFLRTRGVLCGRSAMADFVRESYSAPSLQVPGTSRSATRLSRRLRRTDRLQQDQQRWTMPARYFTRTNILMPDHTVEFFLSRYHADEVQRPTRPYLHTTFIRRMFRATCVVRSRACGFHAQ